MSTSLHNADSMLSWLYRVCVKSNFVWQSHGVLHCWITPLLLMWGDTNVQLNVRFVTAQVTFQNLCASTQKKIFIFVLMCQIPMIQWWLGIVYEYNKDLMVCSAVSHSQLFVIHNTSLRRWERLWALSTFQLIAVASRGLLCDPHSLHSSVVGKVASM